MKEVLELFNNTFKENDTIVCATSGGVDSMTLLKLLIDYRNNNRNINIICAHVNHNFRSESFEEYDFVKKYAEDNNIVFEGTIFEKHTKGNFESEARTKRYNFFSKILNKYQGQYLLTAHHGDDLIETILMRLTRGSTLNGYMGFSIITKKNNYSILRPLIYYTKEDIKKFAKENNIEYRDDKTNYDTKYTRNRYRKEIVPLFKKEQNNVHSKFLKFSNIIYESSKFINAYTNDIYINKYKNGKIKIDDLKNIDCFIIKQLLYKILGEIYKSDISRINDKHIDQILKIIFSNKPNVYINLPLNVVAIKDYKYFSIKKSDEYNEYKIEITNKDIILNNGIIKKIKETDKTDNTVCHLDSTKISLPLYVRNKRAGDYIEILGLNGKKKLKDIFIDCKISAEKRKNYPVIVDSNDNILWVPGLKKSKYDSLKLKKYDIILWYIDKEEKNE